MEGINTDKGGTNQRPLSSLRDNVFEYRGPPKHCKMKLRPTDGVQKVPKDPQGVSRRIEENTPTAPHSTSWGR